MEQHVVVASIEWIDAVLEVNSIDVTKTFTHSRFLPTQFYACSTTTFHSLSSSINTLRR